MQRAFISPLRNVSTSELPIFPFLAPRVFTRWPSFAKSRRQVKTTPGQDFLRAKSTINGAKDRGDDSLAVLLQDRHAPSGGYVEDFAETFGEDETRFDEQMPSANNLRNDTSKQPLNSWSDDAAVSGTYTPITKNLQKESPKQSLDHLSQDRALSAEYVPLSTSSPKDLPRKSSDCPIDDRAMLKTYIPIVSATQKDGPGSSPHWSGLPLSNFHGSSTPLHSGLQKVHPKFFQPPIGVPHRPEGKMVEREIWQRFAEHATSSCTLGQFGDAWAQKFQKAASQVEFDCQTPSSTDEADIVERAQSLGQFLIQYQGRRYSRIFKFWKACIEMEPDTIPVLLYLLRDSPSKALETLLSIRVPFIHKWLRKLKHDSPLDRQRFIMKQYLADALDLIATYFDHAGSGSPAVFDEVYSEVMKALPLYQGERETLNDMTFCILVKHCGVEQISTLYDTMVSEDVECHDPTRLRFARFFALNGQYRRTLQVLKNMSHSGADVTGNHFQSISNLALRRSMLCEDGYHDNPLIIAEILEIGIPMNIKHYSVVMINAIEAGDYAMALRTYNLLKDHGPLTNPWVYSIMLKGCMTSLDLNTFQMVRQDILDARVLSNDFVAGIFICTHFIFLLKNPRRNGMLGFNEVVNVFCQIFDPTPLADLRILPFGMTETKPNVRKATPFAIGVVLSSFIRAHMGGRTFDYFMLEKTYRQFRDLVEEGHEIIGPTVEQNYVSNTFLYAFSKSSDHLKKCLDIMKDMTTPLPPTVIHQGTKKPIRPAQPDVLSWSILSNGFSQHGQNAAAERVLEIMQEHGVEPNNVTWTSLANGYSKAQDVSGLLDVLLRMDANDIKMDDRLLNVLERLNDRQGLLESLNRAQMAKNGERSTTRHEAPFFSDEEDSHAIDETRRHQETIRDAIRSDVSSQPDVLQRDHLPFATTKLVANSNH